MERLFIDCPNNCQSCRQEGGTMYCVTCSLGYKLNANNNACEEYLVAGKFIF